MMKVSELYFNPFPYVACRCGLILEQDTNHNQVYCEHCFAERKQINLMYNCTTLEEARSISGAKDDKKAG